MLSWNTRAVLICVNELRLCLFDPCRSCLAPGRLYEQTSAIGEWVCPSGPRVETLTPPEACAGYLTETVTMTSITPQAQATTPMTMQNLSRAGGERDIVIFFFWIFHKVYFIIFTRNAKWYVIELSYKVLNCVRDCERSRAVFYGALWQFHYNTLNLCPAFQY